MSLLGAFIVPHPPLIIPEIGKGQERKIQKTIDSYHEVAKRIAALKPDTIILISPHSIMYSDYINISPGHSARGDFGNFDVPNVKMEVTYDTDFVKDLCESSEKNNIHAGILGEKKNYKALDHGTMVPLYFLNQYLKEYRVVRISISGLSPLTHYQFGKCIASVADTKDKNYVLIASGDLSHRLKLDGPYGYAKEGVLFDQQITEAMSKGDFLNFLGYSESFCEEAAECGLRSFIIMAGALDGKTVDANLLSYEGPFGVGYGVASFLITGDDEQRQFDRIYKENQKKELSKTKQMEDDYVKLARQSLEHYIKNHNYLECPKDLLPELTNKRAGVFVSLKKEGRLRGCIGTIMPTQNNIAEEIIQNAVSAGIADPRFEPVEEKELPWLVYDVDVLSDSEPISSMDELDVKRYGVIVTYKQKRGLLLPNLEGVNTPEQQVSIALQKANISPEDPYSMERFEVVRHL